MIELPEVQAARPQTILLAGIALLIISGFLWLQFRYEERRYTDRLVMIANASDSLRAVLRERSIPEEDRRLAASFVADTLPGLMRLGLIRSLLQSERGTVLLVDQGLWRSRSDWFKLSLLRQLLVYARIRQEASLAEVRDDRSRLLLAEAISAADLRVYR